MATTMATEILLSRFAGFPWKSVEISWTPGPFVKFYFIVQYLTLDTLPVWHTTMIMAYDVKLEYF